MHGKGLKRRGRDFFQSVKQRGHDCFLATKQRGQDFFIHSKQRGHDFFWSIQNSNFPAPPSHKFSPPPYWYTDISIGPLFYYYIKQLKSKENLRNL